MNYVSQRFAGWLETDGLGGFASGTVAGFRTRRYHALLLIHLEKDGLLAAGAPGVQLTWMDAKIGDWVVTPRIGKPVEVQALWLNALWIGGQFSKRWLVHFHRGLKEFRARFWNERAECLYDVVDPDHRSATVDATFRPNQILAIGGLPIALLEEEQARRVVDFVETHLWTPLGLRSLDPRDDKYAGRYNGGVNERDGTYHQGAVWPWLAGPFIEAWVRVRGGTTTARREARDRFLAPLLRHLDEAGLGHISEIADGDAPHMPHMPRGCPFQAWSLGEALRVTHGILRIDAAEPVVSPTPGDNGGEIPRGTAASTSEARAANR